MSKTLQTGEKSCTPRGLFWVHFLCLFTAIVFGCTPWDIKELREVSDQKQLVIGKYRLQLNLHAIKGYEPEKMIFVWCQTSETSSLTLASQLGQYQEKAGFTTKGWQKFKTYPSNANYIDDSFVKAEFKVVNDNIAYMGPWNTIITFDACRNTVLISPNIFFSDWLNTTRPSFEVAGHSFFRNYKQAADGMGGCFEVNPWYIKKPDATFQLCTSDSGKSWTPIVSFTN